MPDEPKIYHITHMDNLFDIIRECRLWSDAQKIAQGFVNANIGMNAIKQRRLTLPVDCWTGTHVGEYVPFYFCPRSVMLYLLYMSNHPDLTYHGGQGPIVHLVARLRDVVEWTNNNDVKWAFTATNAGARYTIFYNDLSSLDEIDWRAVDATDFRDSEIKEGKQAEFLVFDSLPWELVTGIGVQNKTVSDKVKDILNSARHQPIVRVKKNWYY